MQLSLSPILFFPFYDGVVNALPGRELLRRVVVMLACSAIGGQFLCALSLFADYRLRIKGRSPSSQSKNGER
jgi:hypothetical protein